PAWGGTSPLISQREAWKSSIESMASSREVCTHFPSPALDEGDQDALGEENARAQVGDGDADAHGPLARDARDGHEAPHALRDLADARPVTIRPALPEAGDAPVDQARVEGVQALVVDAEAPLDVGTIVLDHDIGRPRELLEDGHALRLAEVQSHGLLAAMQV